MVLYADGGYAKAYNIENISNTEEIIPSNGKWTMTMTSAGMRISPAYISNSSLSIGSNTTSNVSLKVEADTGATYQRWNMQRVTTTISCGRLYDLRTNRYYKTQTNEVVRYVAPEESRTLSQFDLLGVACRSTNNAQSIQWRSSNTNIAKVNSSTGAVTGVSPGTVNIYSNNYSFGYTLIVTEIPNGIYFIENKETAKCIDIQNQVMADGTQIHQWGFHGGNTQRWEIEHYNDGYYYIRSYNASAVPFYYLTVQNNSTLEGAKVILQSSISTGSQWKITSTASGAYKITAKTGENNNRVLAVEVVSGDNTANGLDMEQKNYQNNYSYLDEWNILLPDNYLGSLQYWYDNESNNIGSWETSPQIYREKLYDNENFSFDNATTSAVEQWNNALGLSMSFVPKSDANIFYYGGTVTDIECIIEETLQTGTLGLTKLKKENCNEVGYYSHEGEIKHKFLIRHAECFLVYGSGMNNEQYIKTGTHELGHALGFLGHITDSTAIMKQGFISIHTLTNKDKLHLQQVYN